jgi:hypothetical protein
VPQPLFYCDQILHNTHVRDYLEYINNIPDGFKIDPMEAKESFILVTKSRRTFSELFFQFLIFLFLSLSSIFQDVY